MRNRAEVDATLQTAKVNPAELLPVVHCLSFGPQAAAGECCLLQLEPGLCAEIEAGCRYGRGGTCPLCRGAARPGGGDNFHSVVSWGSAAVVAGTATRARLMDRGKPAPRREAGVFHP